MEEQSTGELVKQLSEQVSSLVRDEMKMARLELARKGKQAGMGAGMFGVSGLVALYGVACLLAAAIIAINGDPQQLEAEIDRTRERLGETVEALAAKADVKARAQQKATELTGRLQSKANQAKQQITQRPVTVAVAAGAVGAVGAVAATLVIISRRRRT